MTESADRPQEPDAGAAPPPGVPETPPPGTARRTLRLEWMGLCLFVLYALSLMVMTLDRLAGWGWFPTKLERRICAAIDRLDSPEESDRLAARSQIRDSEAFVAIPELVRRLDDASPRLRQEADALLRELTWERLHGALMGYSPDAPSPERRQARQRLRDWWESVESDY
ncbi:MAG: hypothetical protein HYU36_13420 [Planctomycetes bacterium]|nr:hypothetical protein [Planctomycetota bacterium]